ncbi:MAG: Ig-like domain repeat protein, partial [Chloroflexota bacterium]
MRNRILWLLSGVVVLLIIFPLGDIRQDTSSAVIPSPQASSVDRSTAARQASLEMPILFIENQGQADSSIAYYAMAGGQTVYLTPQSIGFNFIRYTDAPEQQDASLTETTQRQAERLVTSIDFLGANSARAIEGRNKSRGVVNYLIGNDPAKWHTDIPTYAEVVYTDIYPGIDLRLYSQNSALRYDFVVSPGASVDDIALAYRGVEKIAVDSGDLVVTTAFGDLLQSRPYIYQQINDTMVTVEGGFELLASQNGYGFEVTSYDSSYPLVIDPVLGYSSYFGGTDNDKAWDVEFVGSYAYITGYTASDNTSFPLYPSDVFDNTFGGGSVTFPYDAFVAKIDTSAAGTDSLVYSTYLGGSGSDYGHGIRVYGGEAYVAGMTLSSDFPVTANASQSSLGGGGPNGDVFLTRLATDGKSLVYSTYFGGSGSDSAWGLYIAHPTEVYVAGSTSSTNLPGTISDYYGQPYGGSVDALVAKFNSTAGNRIFSGYFGGSGIDEAKGIAITDSNCPVIVGTTYSSDLPVTANAYDSSLGGSSDAFVARLQALPSSAPMFSTYLGGDYADMGEGIYSNTQFTVYITGTTNKQSYTDADYPTTTNAFQPSYPCSSYTIPCGFVTVMNIPISGSCTLIYSSYFGTTSTSRNMHANDLAVSSSGGTYYYVYITGDINDPTPGSTNLPTKHPFQPTSGGGGADCFVAKFNPNLSGNDSLVFSSYLGGAGYDIPYGIAANASDEVCIVGECSSGFPVTSANAYQSSYQGGTGLYPCDAFVTTLIKLDTTTTITSDTPDPSAFGQSVAFTASVTAASGTPTGSVEFFNGATSLGTAALSSGSATLNYSSLAVGTHTNITATYSGDTSYNTSTSAAISHTVNKANTTTTITSDTPDPSVFGQSVAFTASVAASAPGSGTPTGNVEFFNGATSLGTAAISGGSATLNYSSLAVGTHTNITAQYLGDTNFNTSTSSAISHTVNKANTTTTINSDTPDPSVFGQSVAFTASVAVSAPGSGTPTGNVEFFNGATSLG